PSSTRPRGWWTGRAESRSRWARAFREPSMSDEANDIEQRVVAVLDGLGVPYELQPIDPSFADTAAYCEHYGVPLEHAANTIIVASKKEPRRFAACVVKA